MKFRNLLLSINGVKENTLLAGPDVVVQRVPTGDTRRETTGAAAVEIHGMIYFGIMVPVYASPRMEENLAAACVGVRRAEPIDGMVGVSPPRT